MAVQIPLPVCQKWEKFTTKISEKTVRAWLDDFRTYDWEKAFPSPELITSQVKELLDLVG